MLNQNPLETIDPVQFGARLKRARELAGLSLVQVGKLLLEKRPSGFSALGNRHWIDDVEQGKQRLTDPSVLVYLAVDLYGVELRDALNDPPPFVTEKAILAAYKVGEVSLHDVARHFGVGYVEAQGITNMDDPAPMDRNVLGRLVRAVWVEYCKEIGDSNPAHLMPYDLLNETDKEADRRIGEAVMVYVLDKIKEGK